MNHVTHTNDEHVTYMKERIHVCDMIHSCKWHARHSYVSHDSCVTWFMCDMMHVWHDSCVTWFMCDMIHLYDIDSFVWVTCLIRMRNKTHLHMRHASVMCVTWRIHIRNIMHPHVWHASFIHMTCLAHISDMSYSYEWHASVIYVCLGYLMRPPK